jgi:hypothetical protein
MNLLNAPKLRPAPFQIRHSPLAFLAVAWITLAGVFAKGTLAQETFTDEAGAEVLTRGPVHEAFAGVISYDSVPGIVVTAAPPTLIEEIPPGERPIGDDVTWIPGYWAWDDERNDFLWISGIWRALPPGREWIVGYWGDTTEGYQWTSGYWADVTTTETTYLPAPPRSVEEGPNIAAPSRNHGWTPGCWIWSQERYAWSPGYWAEGRSDWDWIPAHYVWTRRGYVFVDGYWDHTVQRRGVLFAPVYFDRDVYTRPSYSYSPSVVINLATFVSHLFLRPRYDHYYFGDYYAPRYQENGYYSSFSYQSSRRGYDPVYAHQRWENRDDRDWERSQERDYQFRRDDESARPPRTWAAQRLMDNGRGDVRQNRSMMATSLNQMSKREGSSTRFQSVAQEDRQALAQRGKEVQKSRDERRVLESKNTNGPREGGQSKALRVPSAKSPIAAKARKDRGKKDSPPEPQRAPKQEKGSGANNEGKDKPQQQPGRPSEGDKGKDKKTDAPRAPMDRPQQPPTQRQPERPTKEDKGNDKKANAPRAPMDRPQQPPTQRQPERPSKENKGNDKKADAPQAPKARPQQPPTQPQPGRPAKEKRGKGKSEAPKVHQSKPQSAPPPPKAAQPPAKEKGNDKKDAEEFKGKKKKK